MKFIFLFNIHFCLKNSHLPKSTIFSTNRCLSPLKFCWIYWYKFGIKIITGKLIVTYVLTTLDSVVYTSNIQCTISMIPSKPKNSESAKNLNHLSIYYFSAVIFFFFNKPRRSLLLNIKNFIPPDSVIQVTDSLFSFVCFSRNKSQMPEKVYLIISNEDQLLDFLFIFCILNILCEHDIQLRTKNLFIESFISVTRFVHTLRFWENK